jgi:hypothetical protein
MPSHQTAASLGGHDRRAAVVLLSTLVLFAHTRLPAQSQTGPFQRDICTLTALRSDRVVRVRFVPEGIDQYWESVVGPLQECTRDSLVLGPYPGQPTPRYSVPKPAINRVWVRSNWRVGGLVAGAAFGAGAGAGIASIKSNLCVQPVGRSPLPCPGHVARNALIGAAVGGIIGWVLGQGLPRWARVFP